MDNFDGYLNGYLEWINTQDILGYLGISWDIFLDIFIVYELSSYPNPLIILKRYPNSLVRWRLGGAPCRTAPPALRAARSSLWRRGLPLLRLLLPAARAARRSRGVGHCGRAAAAIGVGGREGGRDSD